MYGGAAPNPLFALIEIISKLKDAKGKILIPGFYSKVKAPTKAELAAWKKLPFKEEHYRKTEVGSKVLTGEPGYSVLYRTWARPTLEVHGMPGGFVASGAKTVIPARASAKVSMRLVPNQDPDDILKRYLTYVKKLTPKGIELNVIRVLVRNQPHRYFGRGASRNTQSLRPRRQSRRACRAPPVSAAPTLNRGAEYPGSPVRTSDPTSVLR